MFALTVMLVLDGFVMETTGATHGLYATLIVLLSVPQEPTALKTTTLLPLDNGMVAVTCPLVGLNCAVETGVPFTVKETPCPDVTFCTDPLNERLFEFAVNVALLGLVIVTTGGLQGSYRMTRLCASFPQALVADNEIVFIPFDKVILAVTCPFE